METTAHCPYDKEIAFYESIRAGNIKLANLLSTPLCSEGYGRLSKDDLRNIKYHLVISIAMITRFCIEGGMPAEEAYSLSDVFIMLTDEAKSINNVHEIHNKVIEEFCSAMHKIKLRGVYSLQVIKSIDYIKLHILEKFSINDIADYLCISVPYLSRIFKSETGENISEYIIKRKIELALIMIKYSDENLANISCNLNFSSQSYFTKVFRKYTGMTPKEYKNSNFFISPKEILEERFVKNSILNENGKDNIEN